MKTFRFVRDDGSTVEDFSTLTVSELRKLIAEYPDDMPVLATWEGIYTPFRSDKDYTGSEIPDHDCWHPDDRVECLVFDVDQH